MSVPTGYKSWCEARALSPFHPEQWPPDQHQEFIRWKVGRFRDKWHGYGQIGQTALILEQSGRASLLNHVKADLAEALAPLARAPWQRCPCHPHQFFGNTGSPNPWENRLIYVAPSRGQRALKWLRVEFDARRVARAME